MTASTSGLTLSRFLLTVFVVGSVLLGFGIQDRKLSGLIHMACTISMFLFPPVLALSFNGFKRAVALEWRNRPPPVATQPAGPEIGPSAT